MTIFSTYPSAYQRCAWLLNLGSPPTPTSVKATVAGVTTPILTIQDYEAWVKYLTPQQLEANFAAARENGGTRLGSYAFPITGYGCPNRDELIAYERGTASIDVKARMLAWLSAYKGCAKHLDCVCPDAYLCEPIATSIERDLVYPKSVVTHCHRHYPGKAVHLFVRGAYGLTAEHTPIPHDVLLRYSNALLASKADGIVLWESEQWRGESDELGQLLAS